MCPRMFPTVKAKIERYVGGLPDAIHDSVLASRPTAVEDAIEFATELIDKRIRTHTERQIESKRKADENFRNQHQQPPKRHNPGRVYVATNANYLYTKRLSVLKEKQNVLLLLQQVNYRTLLSLFFSSKVLSG